MATTIKKYKGTLLSQTNDPVEIQKADLDLLKKINELADQLQALQTAYEALYKQVNP